MRTSKHTNIQPILKSVLPVLVILCILLFLQLVYARRQTDFVHLYPENGILDVSDIDFSDEICTIANDWDFYPNRLYDSEDFKKGADGKSEISAGKIPYGTHRLLLKASPSTYYAFCGYTCDYASRVFVNGAEVACFGVVTDNKKTSVAKTEYQSIPVFTDESGYAEIIIQYNNFVHKDGGNLHMMYFSTPQNIEQYKIGNMVVSAVLGGGLLILSMYFLLLAAVQRQINYLLLAFCCFVFSMRDQLFGFVCLLTPSIPWEVEYRMYIAIMDLLPMPVLLLLGNLYPIKKTRGVIIYSSLIIFSLVFIGFLDTRNIVSVNYVTYTISLVYLVYLIYHIAGYIRRKKSLDREEVLVLIGFGILLLSLGVESVLSRHNASMLRYGLTPSATLLFVFLIAAAISLRVQNQEIALAKSQSRSEMLEKMSSLNMDFLHEVAHELKTPLTVISGYAQLTGIQITSDNINEETPANLKIIQHEASRLADMVTRLVEFSYGKNIDSEPSKVDVDSILSNVKAICTPVGLKNNNRIIVSEANCSVFANAEMLLQIFINLVINANKHTQNGTITIRVRPETGKDCVLFLVEDTGSGIEEKHISHIFEKGYSIDGGSGLGLAIAKDAVEAQKGKIWLERTSKDGTVFAFTVPRTEE